MLESLKKKISTKKARLAIIGLGYVGLPLAVSFAKAGFKVLGLDTDADRIRRLKDKKSYILDISSVDIARVSRGGRFEPSSDFSRLRNVNAVIICVPTPLKRKYTPDISYILNAVQTIRRYIEKGTLVILESTTYPGTTEELIRPELEKSGLKYGRDFYLSFSPERIDPGNKKYGLTKIPKVVGGVSAPSGLLAKMLYEKIVKKVHMVSSARAAEMTKLLENSFRIINIGWINEIAMMCHRLGIDVWEVIEAARTKPFGFMPFYPGLGVGGHCIPEDPLYLYWKAKQYGFSSKFIKLAADTNSAMPQYATVRLRDILKKAKKSLRQSKILVVGVTYKKDVKDLRKSPALRLIELLKDGGCDVAYFDPYIPYLAIADINMKSIRFKKEILSRFDVVLIATDHTNVDYKLLLKSSKAIFDTRNVYKNVKDQKITRL